MTRDSIRRSVIAGTWYPGEPAALRRAIDGFLAKVPDLDVPQDLIGLVAPHAGYVYSGSVAAYAYSLVRGRTFDLVAVVSPMHRMWAGSVAVTTADFYETPMGKVAVARDAVGALGEAVDLQQVGQDNEHSLEIQLPFLQHVLSGDFRLLPVMMGEQGWDTCSGLANALADVLKDENALLVASTDLSHFHPQAHAQRLDRTVLDAVNAFDPKGLSQALARGSAEACGGGPVVAVMLAAKALGATDARVLNYATSGDVTGDYSSVVGYMAASIYRSAS